MRSPATFDFKSCAPKDLAAGRQMGAGAGNGACQAGAEGSERIAGVRESISIESTADSLL
jgi:hypothetical protein